MQDDKSYAIIKRMERQEHTETDLKEILQGIQRTQGQLIQTLIQNSTIFTLMNNKLVDLDKQFYSALFTVIKSSTKWMKYGADVLVISFIPTLISINLTDNDEIVEVILLTIYNEYYEQINGNIQSMFQFHNLGIMQKKYENEFKDVKKNKKYMQITEINQNNILEMHQMLLELLQRYLLKLDYVVLKQVIKMGLILCGVKLELSDLKQDNYSTSNYSLFNHQLTDKSFEVILFMACSLQLNRKDLKNSDKLIDFIRKKSVNECKFNIAGLAQSVKEVTSDIYDGLF